VPAKGGHGLKIASSNKDDSDDDEIVRVGTTKPALLQASVAAKDGHSMEIARVDKDNSDDNKSVSAGTRKPAWLQALAATAQLDGGVSRTPRNKARGGEAQFPFHLDCEGVHRSEREGEIPCHRRQARQSVRPEQPAALRQPRKAEVPKAPAKGGHGVKIASHVKDDSDDNEITHVGATKPALLQASAAAAVGGEVSAKRRDGCAGMYPDDGIVAAADFAPRAKGCMPDDKVRAALDSLTGAKVVRSALAALRDNTDDKEEQDDNNDEEPSNDGNEDGFVITQDNNTKDNETLSGEASKVQQAGGR
jgi:hypothetical protein